MGLGVGGGGGAVWRLSLFLPLLALTSWAA